MTKNKLREIFQAEYLFEQATYDRLLKLSQLIQEYLYNEDEPLYLVTSESYDSPGHPNEIHLATHDVGDALRKYTSVRDQGYGFGFSIYKIPMDEPSTTDSGPGSKTTWLSDCQIYHER